MARPGEVKIELEECNPERDEKGYLNCNKCSRRFYTNGGFIIHLENHHGTDAVLSLKEQKTLPQDSGTMQKQTILGVQKPLQFKESITSDEHKSILIKQETSDQIKLTPYQCQECKKGFCRSYALQRHIKVVHEKLILDRCQKTFGLSSPISLHTAPNPLYPIKGVSP